MNFGDVDGHGAGVGVSVFQDPQRFVVHRRLRRGLRRPAVAIIDLGAFSLILGPTVSLGAPLVLPLVVAALLTGAGNGGGCWRFAQQIAACGARCCSSTSVAGVHPPVPNLPPGATPRRQTAGRIRLRCVAWRIRRKRAPASGRFGSSRRPRNHLQHQCSLKSVSVQTWMR